MSHDGQLYLCKTFGLKTRDPQICAKRRAARSGSGKSRHHRFPGCLECGAELEPIESADQSFTPPPPAADPPKIEEENMATVRKCPRCGEVKEILPSGYCLECQRARAREAYYRKKAKDKGAAKTPAAKSPAEPPKPAPKTEPPSQKPPKAKPPAALAPLNADAERLAAAQGPRIIITGHQALAISAYMLAAKAEPRVRQQYALMIGHAILAEEPAS